MRVIFHIDMDAFFASVEQVDHPEYAGKPLVVGADPKGGRGRGVVSTASYEARKFGIHSAMPVSKAYQLCPDAVFVKPRMERYSEISDGVFSIFGRYTPLVEEIGIDEGFLDCTGSIRLFGPPVEIAKKIQEDIRRTYGLTASIGIASNKSVAKIASDLHKPNGITVCEEGKEREFLAPLAAEKLWGVGKVTLEKLRAVGIRKIGDLVNLGEKTIVSMFGKHGRDLWLLAQGIDMRPVIPLPAERKSVSEEHTFDIDTRDEEAILAVITRMSDVISSRVRALGLRGRTISMKIRLTGFETYTRQATMPWMFDDMATLKREALKLFRNFDRGEKAVRLIGIGMTGFSREDAIEEQCTLFGEETRPRSKSDIVLDRLRAKFGDKVSRGSLIDPEE
jgi:nucleotidyltransferase/DNA polymerase involved in DNA repair